MLAIMKNSIFSKKGICLIGAIILALIFQFSSVQKASAADKGYISFTFDDGLKSQASLAYPILKERGFAATAYITTDWIGIPNPKFMNWNEVRMLQNEGGWEIGNHTANHDQLWKKKFSAGYIQKDIERSQNILVANGIQKPVSFAPPYGKWNSRLTNIVRSLGFTSSRRAWIGKDPLNDPSDYNHWAMEAVSLKKSLTFKKVKKYIDWAAENDEWLIFVIHGVREGKSNSGQFSASELRKIADYVKELEIKGEIDVMTVREMSSRF